MRWLLALPALLLSTVAHAQVSAGAAVPGALDQIAERIVQLGGAGLIELRVRDGELLLGAGVLVALGVLGAAIDRPRMIRVSVSRPPSAPMPTCLK